MRQDAIFRLLGTLETGSLLLWSQSYLLQHGMVWSYQGGLRSGRKWFFPKGCQKPIVLPSTSGMWSPLLSDRTRDRQHIKILLWIFNRNWWTLRIVKYEKKLEERDIGDWGQTAGKHIRIRIAGWVGLSVFTTEFRTWLQRMCCALAC